MQHITEQIIFPFILKTVLIAQMMSTGGEREIGNRFIPYLKIDGWAIARASGL